MSFLPVQAANRSQRVRIGGKTILPNVTSYIDLGTITPVELPKLSNNEVGKKAAGRGLKKSVYFAYGITAVDSSGTETPVSVSVVKTGAVTEEESKLDFTKVEWTPVAHAVSYNVYRSGVGKTGFESEALALAGELKLLANVKASEAVGSVAKYEDTNGLSGSEEGTTAPTGGGVNKTFYNTSGTAWSTKHELQNHLAIGAVIIVGNITPNPNDWAPYVAGDWALTLGAEEVKLAEAKELLQRSTGLVRKVAATAPKAKKCAAGKERFTAIVYNTSTNVVESIEGAEETEKIGSSANVLAKVKTTQQLLLVVRTTESVTTPEVVSGRENIVRVAV